MSKSKRFLWSLVYAVGMFPLGLVSSFLLPVAPVYCGVLMALNVALSLWLGPVSACIGAGAFCLGTALFTLAVDPNIWPIAAWLFVLTAGITVMIDVQLRRKTPLFYTMLNAGLTIVVFGALSYIALNFTVGDFVTLVGEKIGKGLESVAEASPPALRPDALHLVEYGRVAGCGSYRPCDGAGRADPQRTDFQLVGEL